MLRKVSQTQKIKGCMFSLTWERKKKENFKKMEVGDPMSMEERPVK